MDKELLFIQSCTRRGVSEIDLGYMIKWYFNDKDNFFKLVEDMIKDMFFDHNNRIQAILKDYEKIG